MGADFLFAATPRFKPTPERCREIKTFLREYPEDKLFELVGDYWILGLDDESTAKEIRFRIYEAVLQAAEYDTRETSYLRMPGMDFEATITGGMSWGDSPTEAFNIIGDLTNFADLWDLMRKFSAEDIPDKPDHIKEIDRLKRVCKDYAAIVASYQRERENLAKKNKDSKRNKLIKKLALSYLKANLDDVLEACRADCPYCGGECPSSDADEEDAYCDGWAGDIDGLAAEYEKEMMNCCGTTMPAITEKELENLITSGE